MKIEEIRKLLHAQPFRAFTIHVADGGRISVRHEDFVALAPTGRETIVYQPEAITRSWMSCSSPGYKS